MKTVTIGGKDARLADMMAHASNPIAIAGEALKFLHNAKDMNIGIQNDPWTESARGKLIAFIQTSGNYRTMENIDRLGFLWGNLKDNQNALVRFYAPYTVAIQVVANAFSYAIYETGNEEMMAAVREQIEGGVMDPSLYSQMIMAIRHAARWQLTALNISSVYPYFPELTKHERRTNGTLW